MFRLGEPAVEGFAGGSYAFTLEQLSHAGIPLLFLDLSLAREPCAVPDRFFCVNVRYAELAERFFINFAARFLLPCSILLFNRFCLLMTSYIVRRDL